MSRLARQCSIGDCENPVWAREMCRKHYVRWNQHGDPNTVLVKQSRAGEPAAFLEGIPHEGEGCLRWPFATNGAGYAQINIPGEGKFLVTRIICERMHGAPPTPRHVAAHACGKGHEACVAPWHLSWKTYAENMADAKRHGTFSLGDAHASRLSSTSVREIRALLGVESQQKIASRFGVSQTMISRIKTGKAWRSVGGAA